MSGDWKVWDSFKFSISFAKSKAKILSVSCLLFYLQAQFSRIWETYIKKNIQVKVSGLITIKDLNAVLLLKKLMHETISRGQQKVFIQSHKHSFQGSFFSSVTLNSFDTKAFVCLQTEFSVLLIVFFPSSTYDEFCAEQKR